MNDFQTVPTQPDWPAMERRILEFWRHTRAFEKLVAKNAEGERWFFLDGPITANNPMGVHHAWGRTYKDLWQRFKAMQGYNQLWQNGFDCQGLWLEVEVERELVFGSKRDIEALGVARFVTLCKQRALRYAAIQTEQSIRLGQWMRWDDPDTLRELADLLEQSGPVTIQTPSGRITDTAERLVGRLGEHPWSGSYFTLSDHNNYAIWHFLRVCHQRGWIYRGTDVMPWCARCGTGISQHEIATEGYQELKHPGVTLTFPLLDGSPGAALLVWTTTPWTLPANVAAAVGPKLTYVQVEQRGRTYYLAEGAPRALQGDYVVRDRLEGSRMIGWRYRGPFDELPAQHTAGAVEAHRVVGWDGVGEQEGTGIVHIAPGCGAEDFELARQMKLPAIAPLDENGCYVEGFGVLTGHPAASVDEMVVEDLRAKGLLYHVAPYVHRYPVCWRCQTPLVFRLVDEWYIHMGQLYDTPRSELTAAQKAASLRYQIMDVAEQIRWIPAFGLERELDWLRNMQDWMISKKRYWGLALPIWRCGECGWFDVIGSRDELRRRAVEGWQAFDGHAPHRPHVDAVKIGCQSCGAHVTRVPDVGNVWLDAGIVPYSTLRYPHDRGFWGSWFPAEFITESFPGQFRNWFYSLLAMSTVLERRPPFNTVLGFATLLAEDGQAMHKSWGNAIEFNEAADRLGSDVMRWVYASQRPDQNLLFGYSTGREARRQFLIPLWNVYAFLVQYARLAEPLPHVAWQAVAPGAGETVLDQWILARLRDVIDAVTCCLEDFDAHGATVALSAFVDELSNWYVRRSRRRFWEGRPEAMITLYHVMAVLSRLLAPILPFTAEEMYQNLVRRLDREAPESVHHTAWPRPDPDWRDDRLVADMHLVMRLAGLGRAARGQAGVKLRQPLARAMLALRLPGERERVERLEEHLRDELNVKGLEYVSDESELIRLRLRPVLPALGPRFGPRLEAIRQALEAAPPELARRARAGHSIAVTVDDQPVELAAAEVEVLAEPRAGLAIQGEDGYVVGVTTEVTPELEREGLARDIVRLLQTTRKNAGLEITDRIEVRYEAGARVAEAIEEWRDYVAAETLAVLLECGAAWPDGVAESAVLDGEQVRLAIRTAQPA